MTDVICRMLGFSTGTHTQDSTFGNVPEPYILDDVDCDGELILNSKWLGNDLIDVL